MKISIIIPALDEAGDIVETLHSLQALRGRGHEVILVDGGSMDDTVARAEGLCDLILHTDKGRALQMNAGARQAGGDMLLFLHADTRLPPEVDVLLAPHAGAWGRFDLRLSGRHAFFRVIAWCINLRSRLTGVATGDQAIFVSRRLFQAAGGYPGIPIMEDIALSRALKRRMRPVCLRQRVFTSSRRWEEKGMLRTVLLMWRLRLGYYLGADPGRLAGQYDR